MIRSNVPVPLLFRLRMRAHLLAKRAHAGLQANRQRVGVDNERAKWSSGSASHIAEDGENRGPGKHVKPAAPLKRTAVVDGCSPEMWCDFIERYERFTSALCCAAKDGCSAKVEREYSGARWWFATYYKHVAPRLRPYLDAELGRSDTCHMAATMILSAQKELDPVELLFEAISMRDLLHSDQGDLLPRINRISDAVYRCHSAFETV